MLKHTLVTHRLRNSAFGLILLFLFLPSFTFANDPKPVGIRVYVDKVVFTFDDAENDQGLFTLTHQNGTKIKENEIELVSYGAIFTVSKSLLPPGTYTVRVQANNELYLETFTIE